MANTGRSIKARSKKQKQTRTTALSEGETSAVNPKVATPDDLWSEVNTIFRRDEAVRTAIVDNLKARSANSREFAGAARKAFAEFDLSQYSAQVRDVHNYLKPDEKLEEKLRAVMDRGIEAMQSSPDRPSIRIKNNATWKKLISNTDADDDSNVGTIDLQGFMKQLALNHGSVYARPLDSALTICKAELEANRRMVEIKKDDNKEKPKDDNTVRIPRENNSEESTGDTNARNLIAEALVKESVDLQMRDATSAESPVAYKPPKPATQEDVATGVSQYILARGPSDVPAYHDFNALKIAFEDVWTEIFDGNLAALGRELYEEYVKNGVPEEELGNVKKPADLTNMINNGKRFPGLGSRKGLFGMEGKNDVFTAFGNLLNSSNGENKGQSNSLIDDDQLYLSGRIQQLTNDLNKLLSEKYAFTVFAEKSINFGIIVTYRQIWTPFSYQVGELVSTIPLAPKEVRRYTTRVVRKKTRAVKELEDHLQTRKTESSDTSRVDAEIVEKAQNKTSFNVAAHESYGADNGFKIDSTQTASGDDAKQSEKVKKEFRESVLKSSQEYKDQHRVEIDTSESQETEDTTFHELINPNDELAVTYLFYELQRTYDISEKLHSLTPVILVANAVPRPDEITTAWLMEQDWILRRVILDDSFRPALDYLSQSFVGAELNIQALRNNVTHQQSLVDKLNLQIQSQMQLIDTEQNDLENAVRKLAGDQKAQGMLDLVNNVFDPLGITKKKDTGTVTEAQTMLDYVKGLVDRAEREKARLLSQLDLASTALQGAVDKLSAAIKEHYNKLAELDRLRLHVKDNIIYYMQAIWSHEPPDQRFFRLCNIEVPIVPTDMTGATVTVFKNKDNTHEIFEGREHLSAALPAPETGSYKTKKLVEVADLDRLLGYKGNYMIFALKENNYLTLHMMQNYVEIGDGVVARDPDEFANYTLDELQELAACLYKREPKPSETIMNEIKQVIIDRLMSGRKETERVIVPTTSLYIEALVGSHPLLEDFKLIHRALDVKKVQAEVRHAELENIRLASRALKGKDEDPDIEKKVVIENGQNTVIDTD